LADVVLPSLDAPNAKVFERMNRPHASIEFGRLIDGLVQFRQEYAGQIWLEVFFLEGLNDTDADVAEFNTHIEHICPDKIHLNTAVRPTAEANALRVSPERMARLCELLGPKASVATGAEDVHVQHRFAAVREQVFGLLARRPCTLNDVAAGLGVHANEAIKHIDILILERKIAAERRDSETYYRAIGKDAPICF